MSIINGVDRAATNLQCSISVKFVGSARPPETVHNKAVGRAPRPYCCQSSRSLARHVHSFALHQFQRSGPCSHKLAMQHFGKVCWLGTSTSSLFTSLTKSIIYTHIMENTGAAPCLVLDLALKEIGLHCETAPNRFF